jgi:hypothetical protein
MSKRIKIKKDENEPESIELLAKSVIQVAEGFEKLKNTSLTQRAIVVLLQDGIGVSSISKKQIKLVLDALPQLKRWYVKKE